MSIPCPNECGKSVKIGNLNDHNRLCPNQPIECKFCSDKFTPPNFFGERLLLVFCSKFDRKCISFHHKLELTELEKIEAKFAINQFCKKK